MLQGIFHVLATWKDDVALSSFILLDNKHVNTLNVTLILHDFPIWHYLLIMRFILWRNITNNEYIIASMDFLGNEASNKIILFLFFRFVFAYRITFFPGIPCIVVFY